MSIAISAQGLVVEYNTENGKVRALELDELQVAEGESVAIMGASGCGKSTLLALLAGLAVPNRGNINVGGTNLDALSEPERVAFRRQSIGMVFQADNLLPHLTVEENIGLQIAIATSGSRSGPRVVLDRGDTLRVLDRLGIADLAARYPDQLSGGQRQRAAIGRAIAHRPAILLADEPTGALDDATAVSVIELVLEVQRSIHATLVMVTHDPKIARFADRIIVLERPHQQLEFARVG